MKPLSPRTFFIFSSRSLFISPITNFEIPQKVLLRVSHFSSSPYPHHSSHSSSYPSRRHEEESRNVRVSVWWDFENCTLPAGANVFRVAQSITAAIRANGIKGPIQITAFGDVLQLSRSNQEALSSTGINLTHIPRGGKSSADRSLLVDLMYWVSQNPPPAHLFLISGDTDFASILHRLRMNNYNILLASQDSAPGVLCSASSIMWHWNALVKGENLTGKHFNQPPDGPYGSWYGHYRVPLEDPFAVTEQPACSQAEELSESGSDSKLRPVPKAVMKQIRHILNSFPKGISITELRSELGKCNVSIDKDLYGYKKFSRFLLSMPQILKLQSGLDGQFFVRSIVPKVTEPGESTSGITTCPVTNNGEPDTVISPKINGADNSFTSCIDEKSSLPLPPDLNVKEPLTKLQESPKKVEEPPAEVPPAEVSVLAPLVEKVNNAEVTESCLSPVEEHHPMSEVGFFNRIWRKWFGDKYGGSEEKTFSQPEKYSSSRHNDKKTKETGDVFVETTSQCADPVVQASFSSSSEEAMIDDNTARRSETSEDKSSRGPGFFIQFMSWCRFWRTSHNSDNSREQCGEKMNHIHIDSEKQEIFSRESFWNDMAVLIDTPKGSRLVLQSRTREQMAQNLQKQGPRVLITLGQSELLHIVDLLISNKKWVEECPSQTFPFKLIKPAGKNYCLNKPPSSNGLSSIFLDTPPQSAAQRLPDNGEKRHQNLPHTGVSLPVIQKKSSSKSRSEILADCQRLVDDILMEYPEGFNLGSFRKLFLDRYSYPLDLKKLGYQKLVILLQAMPRVKIESNYIIPSAIVSKSSGLEVADPNVQENNVSGTVANSDSEVSDASKKDDDLDSPWDELGPVANPSSKKNDIELGLSSKVKEAAGQRHDYETLSDDYLSDSEEETLSSTESGSQAKPRINEEDSSLLQILDSWYNSKENNNRRVASENVDAIADCSRKGLKSSSSFAAGMKNETPVVNYGRKKRPPKSCSFVSDHFGDNKDKLIDGILGSLKKSGDGTAESSIHG